MGEKRVLRAPRMKGSDRLHPGMRIIKRSLHPLLHHSSGWHCLPHSRGRRWQRPVSSPLGEHAQVFPLGTRYALFLVHPCALETEASVPRVTNSQLAHVAHLHSVSFGGVSPEWASRRVSRCEKTQELQFFSRDSAILPFLQCSSESTCARRSYKYARKGFHAHDCDSDERSKRLLNTSDRF
ncbi:unnamed protein product [Caretta caretta]